MIRTYRTVSFKGRALLKKLEAEEKIEGCISIHKVLPPVKDANEQEELWLQHFPDLYGYRGLNPHNPGVFLMSPWEFTMWWQVLPLPPPSNNTVPILYLALFLFRNSFF